MGRIPRHRPSPAMVVACIALAVSLGGTSYAAIRLPANSVGAKQLKKNAVISAKVKNRSLLAKDFKAGQLPSGPKGAKGDKGDKGDTGAAGAAGATHLTYRFVTITTPNGSNGSGTASCLAGERATGGGSELAAGDTANFYYFGDNPIRDANNVPVGWHDDVYNISGGTNIWRVYVICASP